MNSKIYVTAMVSSLVAVLLIGGVAIPLMDGATKDTVTVENENPQWIRMAYLTDQSDYQVTYTVSGDTVTVTNGDDNQSGALTDTILYADDKTSVMVSDGDIILVGEDDDTIGYKQLTFPIIIDRTGGVLSVTDANDTTTFIDTRTWAYVPLSTEKYGVFSTGDLNRYESALACTGAYAGVYCYNEYVTEDVGLVMDADVTNDYITSVKWALESANNAKINKTPILIDPGILTPEEKEIDPDSLVTIKSVATPTYTDGDWGYDLSGSNATIVSYSGATGGVLTIPATVGGYNVVAVGKGTSETVIDTSSTFTGLIISPGITTINSYAFAECTGLTGSLTLPDSLTTINSRAFKGCTGFTGSLTIPDGVTTIGNNAFQNCSGFTGSLTIPDGVTTIGNYVFQYCSGFTGSLTIPDGVTTIGNSSFSGCSGFTGSLTIPDGVTTIRDYAFQNCSGFTGSLTIPDSVTMIGNSSFSGCSGFTGSLTISDGVTTINANAFLNCSGFTGSLTIPDSVTTIGSNAFLHCDGIINLVILSDAVPGDLAFSMDNVEEVLNLSNVEYTTTSYGMTADSVQDHIDADSYLCITEVTETTQKEGAVFDIFLVLPVVMIAGAVLMAVRFFIRR